MNVETLIENAPQMTEAEFAHEALPALMELDNEVARLTAVLKQISQLPGKGSGTGAAGWLLTLDAPEIARAALAQPPTEDGGEPAKGTAA